jgi:hypothetical protein
LTEASPPDEEPRRKPPGLGTRERLRRARAALREKKMLLSPGRRGALGVLMTLLHGGTLLAAIVALAAPCTAGLMLGVMAAIAGLAAGAIVGVPLVLGVSNALKTIALESAAEAADHPALPEAGGGGSATSVAVGSSERNE